MSHANKIFLAKEFRNNPTVTEHKLWQLLRKSCVLGYKFRRQYVVAGFILDFYCPKLRLGIEVDGGIHDTVRNQEYDRKRDYIIKQYRIKVIRIGAEDIEKQPLNVIKDIQREIKKITDMFL